MIVWLRLVVVVALVVAAGAARAPTGGVSHRHRRRLPRAPAGRRGTACVGARHRAGHRRQGAHQIYFGPQGIAGTEEVVLDRIRRDQLDGAIGSELCTKLAPSLKVARVVGVFQTRDENTYVLSRLKPTLDQEFLTAGFINFGVAGLRLRALVHARARRQSRHAQEAADVGVGLGRRAAAASEGDGPDHRADAARAGGARLRGPRVRQLIAVPTAALALDRATASSLPLAETAHELHSASSCATRVLDALPAELAVPMRSVAGKLNRRRSVRWAPRGRGAARGPAGQAGAGGGRAERLRAEFLDAALRVRPGAQIVPAAPATRYSPAGWPTIAPSTAGCVDLEAICSKRRSTRRCRRNPPLREGNRAPRARLGRGRRVSARALR